MPACVRMRREWARISNDPSTTSERERRRASVRRENELPTLYYDKRTLYTGLFVGYVLRTNKNISESRRGGINSLRAAFRRQPKTDGRSSPTKVLSRPSQISNKMCTVIMTDSIVHFAAALHLRYDVRKQFSRPPIRTSFAQQLLPKVLSRDFFPRNRTH